jgi:hypothetical protein
MRRANLRGPLPPGRPDPSEFSALFASVSSKTDPSAALDRLSALFSSPSFDPDTISYPPSFPDSLSQFFAIPALLSCTLRFLHSAWITSPPALAVAALYRPVTSLVFCGEPQVALLAWSALANLAAKVPTVLFDIGDDPFFEALRMAIDTARAPFGIAYSALRFTQECCQLPEREWAVQLIPVVVSGVVCSHERIREVCAGILVKMLQSHCVVCAQAGALQALIDGLTGANAARTMPFFEGLVIFARMGEVDGFVTQRFMHQMAMAMNQHYSEPAPALYELVYVLMSRHWREFHEFGLVEIMIENADRVVFANKRSILFCILEFLQVSDGDIATAIARDQGGFLLLCRMASILDAADLEPLQKTILRFLCLGEPFVVIAHEEGLADTVVSLPLADPILTYLAQHVP